MIRSASHDGADALGDDDHGRVARLGPQRGAQPRVRGRIEGREAVVEEVDRGPLDERAGDGEPLPLAARDVGAALVDRSRPAARHRGHEVARLGHLERVPELLVGGVVSSPKRRLPATVPLNR